MLWIEPLYSNKNQHNFADTKFAFCCQNIYRYVNEIPGNIII